MKQFFNPLFFVCITLLTFTFQIHAQTPRPKVGLVLSGGGAKGIAHIGVLKAMEEAGLTPDYITGTSMGSIVGALYAAGYSADELREIVLSADWDLLLSNKVPFDKVTFEEKDYYGRYLIDFYMEQGKLLLPKGIIEGQALMELFSDITRPVHGITDFNDLPIPFACVATNIVTGEAEVLNKGSLASSMRASMAIPSIFTPVKIDGKLLVDGGLVRNMPVDEALNMGADIIIGVFVSSDLDPEEKLTSALAILSQSAFITSAFDTREQLKKCDILISPDLKDFSTGSFKEAPAILEKGDEAGQIYLEEFKRLADSLRKFGPLHEVKKPLNEQVYTFKEIVVDGNKNIPDEYIIGKLKVKPGKEITVSDLTNKLTLINGTQYFESISYEILGDSSNRVLRLHVIERPKIQFRFSYHYDTENKGGVVGNMTLRNFLLPSSRFILEADLATYPRVTLDYFKYVGKKQNFALGTSGIYTRDELPSYDSVGNSVGVFGSTYAGWGFKVQTTSFLNSAFGAEVKWTNVNLRPEILDESLRFFEKIQYSNTSFNVYYKFNNYNTRYFPSKGLFTELVFSQTTKANGKIVINDDLTLDAELLSDLLETKGITSAELTFYPIIPIGKKFSILSKSRIKISSLNAGTFNITEYDYIGGVIPKTFNSEEYMGVGLKEFGLSNYFFTRLGFQWEFLDKVYLQGHFNYIDTEFPSKWINPNVETGDVGIYKNRFSYGGSLGIKTPVGPVAVALARDHYRKDLYTTLILGFYY